MEILKLKILKLIKNAVLHINKSTTKKLVIFQVSYKYRLQIDYLLSRHYLQLYTL